MRIFSNTLVLVSIFLLLNVAYVLKESNYFIDLQPHFNGEVEVIESPFGIEDLTIDQSNGDVYFSSQNRRDKTARGDLYKANLNDAQLNFRKITGAFADSEFRPHGISLLKKYGKTYLFAISHRNNENVIERFEFKNDTLVSSKSFRHELLISPNDLCVIDSASFYFSNDHDMKPSLERTLKDFLFDKNGYIVLYHNGKAEKVTQNMAYANGVAISPDEKYVYVAASIEKKVYVYTKDPINHKLKLIDTQNAHTAVDNIEIDEFGNLIVGAHPKMLKFLAHAKSAENLSPSQIIKIIYLPDTPFKFLQEELYLNNGEPLSGSSVGAYYQKKNGTNDLLVGSVFENKILRLHRNL